MLNEKSKEVVKDRSYEDVVIPIHRFTSLFGYSGVNIISRASIVLREIGYGTMINYFNQDEIPNILFKIISGDSCDHDIFDISYYNFRDGYSLMNISDALNDIRKKSRQIILQAYDILAYGYEKKDYTIAIRSFCINLENSINDLERELFNFTIFLSRAYHIDANDIRPGKTIYQGYKDTIHYNIMHCHYLMVYVRHIVSALHKISSYRIDLEMDSISDISQRCLFESYKTVEMSMIDALDDLIETDTILTENWRKNNSDTNNNQ